MIFSDHFCINCKKRFKEGDDIVVCPDCGTPYHRECWLENGECINSSLHESGKSYKETIEPEKPEDTPQKTVICPRCQAVNNAVANSCTNCGERLKSSEAIINELMELLENAEKEAEKSESGDFEPKQTNDFVGFTNEQVITFLKKNTMRYFPLFIMFSRNEQVGNGKVFSFNLAALLFPPLFFAYRKMTGVCLGFLVAMSLFAVPDFIVLVNEGVLKFDLFTINIDIDSLVFQRVSMICSTLTYITKIFAFLFADYFYYKYMTKKIRQINHQCGENVSQSVYLLNRYGGTSVPGIILAIFLMTCCAMGATYIFNNLT
jgi:ribosomal protein L40E